MKEYFQSTRTPWHSYLAVLPLLVLYQVLVLVSNQGPGPTVVNGAEAMLQGFLGAIGVRGWVASWAVLAIIAGIVIYRLDPIGRKAPLRKDHFGLLLAESALYATLFGTVVSVMTALLLSGPSALQIGAHALNFWQKLATSVGAGLYEELVFRLLITGGLLWGLARLGWKEVPAAATAVLVSSFFFSLVHYIGPYADNLQVASFTFRFVAGVMLAALFAARGFAVAAWTHALYDVFLLLQGKG